MYVFVLRPPLQSVSVWGKKCRLDYRFRHSLRGKRATTKKNSKKKKKKREKKQKKYSNFGVFPSETHLVFIGSGEIRRNWLPLDDKLQLNQSVLSHNCASIEALHKYNTGVGFFLSPHAQSLRQFVFLRPVSDAH